MKTLKTLKLVALAATALGVAACDPGQLFGPPTEVVSVRQASLMPGDVLTPYAGWEANQTNELSPRLTDDRPVYVYRVEVQVKQRRTYTYRSRQSPPGTVYANAWSRELGVLSRTKNATAYWDKPVAFEWRRTDFRVFSVSSQYASAVLVEIETGKPVWVLPGETAQVPVNWQSYYTVTWRTAEKISRTEVWEAEEENPRPEMRLRPQ